MQSSLRSRHLAIQCSILIVLCNAIPAHVRGEEVTRATGNWPQWRGPLGTGVAPDADPPIEFSETKNIRWKVALPGKGHSTPVIWGDWVFLTTAVPFGMPLREPRYSGRPGAHDNLPVTHRHKFVLTRVRAKTGADAPGAFRLDGVRNIYASPVGAAGRVYVTDLDGVTIVFSHSAEPKRLALSGLNDRFAASAAISGKELFLRGEKYLYCIAEE